MEIYKHSSERISFPVDSWCLRSSASSVFRGLLITKINACKFHTFPKVAVFYTYKHSVTLRYLKSSFISQVLAARTTSTRNTFRERLEPIWPRRFKKDMVSSHSEHLNSTRDFVLNFETGTTNLGMRYLLQQILSETEEY